MGDWVGKKQSINEVGRGKTARGGGSGLYTHLLCLCGLFLTYSLLLSTLKEGMKEGMKEGRKEGGDHPLISLLLRPLYLSMQLKMVDACLSERLFLSLCLLYEERKEEIIHSSLSSFAPFTNPCISKS